MQADDRPLERELLAGRPVVPPTRGESMQPLLYEGKTLAVLQPVSGPLKKGDVVLYKRPDGLFVMHRIAKVCGSAYVIRGDNCYYQETVYPEQILGVMTEVVRGGKTIPVTDFAYRCYWKFWLASYPMRFVVHKPGRTLYHIKKALHWPGSCR